MNESKKFCITSKLNYQKKKFLNSHLSASRYLTLCNSLSPFQFFRTKVNEINTHMWGLILLGRQLGDFPNKRGQINHTAHRELTIRHCSILGLEWCNKPSWLIRKTKFPPKRIGGQFRKLPAINSSQILTDQQQLTFASKFNDPLTVVSHIIRPSSFLLKIIFFGVKDGFFFNLKKMPILKLGNFLSQN